MECFPIKRDSNDERKQESLKSSFSPLPTLLSYVSSKTHSTFFLALSLNKHFLTYHKSVICDYTFTESL